MALTAATLMPTNETKLETSTMTEQITMACVGLISNSLGQMERM